MVSQSVLLRGVNDDAQTLEALMRAFVECRIKPYYLHHADLAPGTSHFRTSIEEGQALMRALRGRVSGLAAAGLCAGYSRRSRQGAGRAGIRGYVRDAGAVVEDINGRRHRVLGHASAACQACSHPLLHQVSHAHHVDLAGAQHRHLLQIRPPRPAPSGPTAPFDFAKA